MSEASRRRTDRKLVGIWIRVSTSHQAAGDSPQTHEQRAISYAKAKGWDVVEVYKLEGVSGKHVRSHSECKRMMEDVRAGKIEALIFSKLARLARSTRDLLDFADYFKAHSADLISLQESIDTSSHAGRFFYTMLAALAQFEREEVSSRVRAAVEARAKQGKPIGGAAPYGYQWKDKQLVLHPEEAPVRALMFELFSQNPRIAAIARELNDRGYRTRKGKDWTLTSVRNLLIDTTAKGLRRTNYNFRDPVTGKMQLKPESEWTYIQVEPIVSEELFDQVNAVLSERAERLGKRPGRKSRHLFTGLLFCECGKKMYVPSRVQHYSCKSCGNTITAEDLEAIFFTKLKEWLTPETVASILLQTDQKVQERRKLKESLESQLRAAKTDEDQLFELHRAGQLPTINFRCRFEPIAERTQQLEAELASVQGQLDAFEVELLGEQEALAQAEQLLTQLEGASFELKRQAVELLVAEIRAGREEVVLQLNYRPFSSGVAPTSLQTPSGDEPGGSPRPPCVHPSLPRSTRRRVMEGWAGGW